MNYLRIKKNSEFTKLFKRGRRVFSPSLTLIYFPSAKMSMGIAISKKHGKAVIRNRIKRLIREVFAKNSHLLEKSYSVIVLPKVAESYSYATFEKSIVSCFKKVNSCESSKKS
ncbi:MAG: ribonuclease P protein component [Clostridiales bacterium]|nr:ribonuclease P protein component [Clostridiales bacterium]